jgi:catechol 2,3-dioxygenase-like lactoylglutathione lyase family enzyme
MANYVEHVNITVNDLDQAVEFLATALPDFKVRHREEEKDRVWAHIGNDDTYVAMTCWRSPPADKHYGLNHIGLVVDDIRGVQQRLLDGGYPKGFQNSEIVEHPHRLRLYFLDRDNNEYEFVQYLSDKTEERNSYTD